MQDYDDSSVVLHSALVHKYSSGRPYKHGLFIGAMCEEVHRVAISVDNSWGTSVSWRADDAPNFITVDDLQLGNWLSSMHIFPKEQVLYLPAQWIQLTDQLLLIKTYTWMKHPDAHSSLHPNRLLASLSEGKLRFRGNVVVVRILECGEVVDMGPEDVQLIFDALSSIESTKSAGHH
ncbi:hypothetical protein NP233_g9811 [Leucocoprinus birnbaumii]|uniref:Uncharacterized protein n=1 Tax=Leucocoprinus birnbaumii TaxID=56174 RepID=A0AAD5VM33_9AGAR|nr:hypothetical protein NP233_g9811 [Leucocoprinus birnbaumii]